MSEFDYALKCISESFDITIAYLSNASRKAHVVKCRQTLAYILIKVFDIGPFICEKWAKENNIPSFDHSNVIHSIMVIQNIIDTKDKDFIDQVNKSIIMANKYQRECTNGIYSRGMPPGEFQNQRIEIETELLNKILNNERRTK